MTELIAISLLFTGVAALQVLILLELRKIRKASDRSSGVFSRCFPTEAAKRPE